MKIEKLIIKNYKIFNDITIQMNRAKSLPSLEIAGFPTTETVGFEPTCPGGQPHFECGSL